RGHLELLETPEQLLAVRRDLEADERWVIVNFSEDAVAWQPHAADAAPESQPAGAQVPPGRPFVVEISSGGAGALSVPGSPFPGRIGPEEAVVLRLA
ncbi:MAG: hypothetical protein WAL04_09655, partial [Acidimicrobiales bacterium]